MKLITTTILCIFLIVLVSSLISAFEVTFKNDIKSSDILTFNMDNYSFTYDLSGGKMQWAELVGNPTKIKAIGAVLSSIAVISGNEILYPNAFLNTDIKYVQMKDRVKEYFILKSLPTYETGYLYLEYAGELSFSSGLKIVANSQYQNSKSFNTSENIEFRDGVMTRFYLPSPYAEDSAGNRTTIFYDIKPNADKLTFNLRVPYEWLINPARVFPIYIDPSAVAGCDDSSPTTISCNDSAFIGEYINTTKNILIKNASITFSGTSSNAYLDINSTQGWVNITNSTIITQKSSGYSKLTIFSYNYTHIYNSTIIAFGLASGSNPDSGHKGALYITSNYSYIHIFNTPINSYASDGRCNDDTTNSFDGADSNFYLFANQDIIINNSPIVSTGSLGGCCGGETNAKAGHTWVNITAGTTLTIANSNMNFDGGDMDCYIKAQCSGGTAKAGNSTVLFSANKTYIKGYNQTTVTFLARKGTHNGCGEGGTNQVQGGTRVEFKVFDELQLDNNISMDVTGSFTPNNYSNINFIGTSALKFLFSGVSIPYLGFFVLCPNKLVTENLKVVWEQFTGKTQIINFTYCSYKNISRTEYSNQPPTYSNWKNNASSTTYRYGSINFSLDLSDDNGMSLYIFSHNQSGALTNISNGTLSGTSVFTNYTLSITLRKNNYICGQYWFNDTFNSIIQTNMSCFTVQNAPPLLKTDLRFKNSSAGHNFTVNVTFTDWDNASDFVSKTIENSTGQCVYNSNITLADDITLIFNCTGTALTSTTIRINATDGSGITINSSQLTNVFPNKAPTMTGTELNKTSGVIDTDDLNCSAVGKADLDNDATTYHYEWYNNSVAQGYDDVRLLNTNLTGLGDWYCEAWADDTYANSSKYTSSVVTIGSSQVSPTITTANATTANTGINSTATNPTNNNSYINLSSLFTDADNDAWTFYACTTPTWSTCQANTSGEILCKSISNQTEKTLSCIYNVSGYTGTNPLTWFAFVLDNTSKQSTSHSSTFEINYPEGEASLIYPPVDYYTNIPYIYINWTASGSGLDASSDTINYTLYVNESTIFNFVYNGTNDYFNYSIPNEFATYNWRVYTQDEHNYGYFNITLGNFTSDYTNPNATITYPVNGSTIYSKTFTFSSNSQDNYLSNCSLRIYQTALGYGSAETGYDNLTINCSVDKSVTVTAYTDYSLYLYAYDKANNLNDSYIQFTTQVAIPPVPPTGGGGGEPKVILELTCKIDEDCLKYGENLKCIQGYCLEYEITCNYNEICEPERGENIFNCGDEYVNQTLILSGDCHWTSPRDVIKMAISSQYFLWVLLILFTILIIVLNAIKEDSFVKRSYTSSKRWIRKYIRR